MRAAISAIIVMGLAVALMSNLQSASIPTAEGIVATLSSPGTVTNLYFNFWGTITQNLIPIAVTLVLIWGISLTIVAAGGGNLGAFTEHVAWTLGIVIGFMSFVIPGILIWAVMGWRKGGGNAALVLLGPIGSAITSTSGGFESRWESGPPITSFGAGPNLRETWVWVTESVYKASRRAVGLTVLILFAVLGAIGVLSAIMWHAAPWVHFILYVSIAVAFAFAIVGALRAIGAKEASLPWIIGGVALFVLMMSLSDIAISGLKWVGALVGIAAPQAGLFGGLSGAEISTVFTLFSSPLIGALMGQFMSERGWGLKRIGLIVSMAVLAVLMLLILGRTAASWLGV